VVDECRGAWTAKRVGCTQTGEGTPPARGRLWEMNGSTTFLSVASGFSWLLAFAGNVVLLLVVATVVRRHRPDAYKPLLAWTISGLGLTFFRSIFMTVVRIAVSRQGYETMIVIQSIEIVFGSILGVGLVALLAYALVRLAQPPRPVDLPQQPPYR